MRFDGMFDLAHTIAAPLFANKEYPWQILPGIRDFILAASPGLPKDQYEQTAPDVWIAKDANVAPTACVQGPCIVGPGAQIRHCAFVRGSAVIGAGAVVGNSTELKNCILFDGVQVPHFNYVGDSVLGYKAHFGAGVITANVRGDRAPVIVRDGDAAVETGLKKFGAIVGDFAEIGCNSVLCPGCIVGRGAQVYPLSLVRGAVSADSVYKKQGEVAPKQEPFPPAR